MKKDNATAHQSENNKTKGKNKGNFVNIMILFVGILSLILLSINFVYTYKTGPNKEIVNPIISKESAQEIKKNDSTKLEVDIKSTSGTIEEKVKIVTKIEDKCYNYLTFLQEIYNLRPLIEKGDDYSHIMTVIMQYNINNNILQDNLNILSSNAHFNKAKDYYIERFRGLIKPLYKELNHSNYKIINFLHSFFFIRTTGDRAITKGGLDMEIYESEQSLSKHDFSKSLTHLNNIVSKIDEYNNLKDQITAKVNIDNAFQQIENLLLEKVDCGMVSK